MRTCIFHRLLNGLTISFFVASAVLLSGCTSLSDFVEMTPAQRAVVVCYKAEPIQRLKADCQDYYAQYKEIEKDSIRGFSVKKICSDHEVYDGFDEDCFTDKRGNVHCQKRPRFRTVKRCDEYQIPLESSDQKVKLEQAKAAYETCVKSFDNMVEACRKNVMELDAETAFIFYDTSQMPR